MTSLYLVSQDAAGAAALRSEHLAQRVADAAADVVMSWFHDPGTMPLDVAAVLSKQQSDDQSGPSFFDATGRSQFRGTADRPDLLLDAANASADRTLNEPRPGAGVSIQSLGRILTLKVYGPLRPDLLCTMEVTTTPANQPGIARTVQLQFGTIHIPAVRSAVQVGQALGNMQAGGESSVIVHWGDYRIAGDLSLRRIEDLVHKTSTASVTGQRYDPTRQGEDRWAEYYIGGNVQITSPPPGQPANSPILPNLHVRQSPSPGVRLDRWDYEPMKSIARRFGTYYRLDRQGLLHPDEADSSDPGLSPSEVLKSEAVGDHRGLVFIDTLDGEAPRIDNLGTLILDAPYIESLLIVQGHVIVRPKDAGQSVPALSPPEEGRASLGTRIPVQLSDIHFNGVLFVAGTITLEQSAQLYGALMTGDTIRAGKTGVKLEIWYNHDLAQGLFRGIPVVYRVPGTWQLKYAS
jgi:hypothetical protein